MTATHPLATSPLDSPRRAARLAEQQEARRGGSLRQVLRAVGTGVAGALFALVLAIAALVIVVPMLIGGQALTVLTNSMAPGMPPGTLVIVKPTPTDQIEVGDVVTYQIRSGDPAVVSHRVVSRAVTTTGETTFITRGDNNDLNDANPVTEVQIRGTVWYSLPLLGWVNSALSGGARTWLVPVVVSLCFAYGAWAFLSGLRDRRRARGQHAAEHTPSPDPAISAAVAADLPTGRGRRAITRHTETGARR